MAKKTKRNWLHRIFRFQINSEEEKVNENEKIRKQYIPLLEKCTCIQDFIDIHRELTAKGITVNIKLEDQSDNYAAVDVNIASTEHYYCDSYDGDSTYHGSEMLDFENTPSLNEYDYYNYWKAWGLYYMNLYKAITGEKCELIYYPKWLKDLR